MKEEHGDAGNDEAKSTVGSQASTMQFPGRLSDCFLYNDIFLWAFEEWIHFCFWRLGASVTTIPDKAQVELELRAQIADAWQI